MHVWMTLGCREDSKMNKPIDRGRLEVPMASEQFPAAMVSVERPRAQDCLDE